MALIGIAEAHGIAGSHIITSSIEHPAVLETCRYLASKGAAITSLPVGADGIVNPSAIITAIRPNTRIISIMTANNIIGTLQPIAEISTIAREYGIICHTDAVQAFGKIPLNVQALSIDMLSLSAHKLYGPKGVGALYIRKGVKLTPLIHGGGQEKGLRSATLNVSGIVGLGKAAVIAGEEMSQEAVRLVDLRNRIIATLTAKIPNAYLIGHPFRRLPGHIALGFFGREGEAIKLLLAMDEQGIAVSSGSACSSHYAADQPSHVLMAMGMDPVRARGSLRITLGRFNTADEVDFFLRLLPQTMDGLHSSNRIPLGKIINNQLMSGMKTIIRSS